MQTTALDRDDATPTVPETIDSARAKLVYIYLARARAATVDDLAAALDLRKLDLFDVLATLEANGHVERNGVESITFSD